MAILKGSVPEANIFPAGIVRGSPQGGQRFLLHFSSTGKVEESGGLLLKGKDPSTSLRYARDDVLFQGRDNVQLMAGMTFFFIVG